MFVSPFVRYLETLETEKLPRQMMSLWFQPIIFVSALSPVFTFVEIIRRVREIVKIKTEKNKRNQAHFF